MKVLLVNHRFFPVEGGTERWTLGLARALTRRGVEATVLTQLEPGTREEEWVEGIRVLRIPMRRIAGFRLPKGYFRTLRGLDYDLLHMSGNRIWCADFYFPVADIFDGPQVVTPHDFYQLSMNPSSVVNRVYFGKYLPWRFRAFGRYLAMNRREADRITSFGYPKDRVDVVGTALDVSEFTGHSESLNMRERWGFSKKLIALYVGGTWENKRVDRLIRALSGVRDKVALAIVGRDVPQSRYCWAEVGSLAKDLGVEARFLGPLNRAQVVGAYKAADVFLLGSVYEGFGLSLVEAMAAGVPFISFDVGAAEELSETGAGCIARSEEEFAQHLRRLVDDPEERQRMSAIGPSAAARWNWESVVDRYLSAYRKAITSQGPASGSESNPPE